MSTSYSFAIRISVSNDEGREDVTFEETVQAAGEEYLLDTVIVDEWRKASVKADERADDGTRWDVVIECLSVTDPASTRTDWEDDLLPQRDEVSAFLAAELNAMGPGAS